MRLRKKEHPQPRIRGLAKEGGQVAWVTGLFFILFLGILLSCQLQLISYRASSLYLEDALAASNLASALIDIQEYGISHELVITQPMEAYALYRQALQVNLGLNEAGEGRNVGLIAGKVTVEDYAVYNVNSREGTVHGFHVTEDGNVREETGTLGDMRAPNGVLIVSTGVYSEISFPVKGLLGVEITARKSSLVDVTADN